MSTQIDETPEVQDGMPQLRAELLRLREPIDDVDEDAADIIGQGLSEILRTLGPSDRLAALASAISPRSKLLDALARSSGLTEASQQSVDMLIGAMVGGLELEHRNAVLSAVLFHMLPPAAD